jgi:RimJ/RimL family protein N-acetyltransferase
MFTIRRMRPNDKPALMEIASRIWEGFDYLPGVFDEWIADTRGEFSAVLLDGRLAGCGKLTYLTETDAWLEGLRKDPRVSDTGLARVVAEHILAILAARKDLTSVRFSTYVKNRASIVPNERLGFRVRTVLSAKAWQGSRIELAGAAMRDRAARAASPLQVVTVGDERIIAEFLRRSDYFEGTQGLLVEGWRVYPFTAARFLERYAPGGACRGVFRGAELAGLAAWVIGRRPGRTGVKLVFLDAADDEIAGALLDDVFRGLTAAPGLSVDTGETCEVEWVVPPGGRFRRWCGSRALASWEQEDDFLVYELPLEKLSGYAEDGNRSVP